MNHMLKTTKLQKGCVRDVCFDYFLIHQLDRCWSNSGEQKSDIIKRAVLKFLDECEPSDFQKYSTRKKSILLDTAILEKMQKLCKIHEMPKCNFVRAALYHYFLTTHEQIELDINF